MSWSQFGAAGSADTRRNDSRPKNSARYTPPESHPARPNCWVRALSVQNFDRTAQSPLARSAEISSSDSSHVSQADSVPRSASVPPEEISKALRGEAMDDRSSSIDPTELYTAGQGGLNVLSEPPPVATVIPMEAFQRLRHSNHRAGSPFRMCSRRTVQAVATESTHSSNSQLGDFCDADYMYHSSQESSQV
ncbi:hypothetical protein AAVH_02434 [Aphelenchoides avenae]|nr:hypothetical protein AAVH_02434 [Aphelenchus avenae]